MPNRILREGILTSERVDRLSESAEIFYRRLMSRLDDHGRCEANAELLRSGCFPLRVDRVKAKHIQAWIEECRKAGLLLVYQSSGKSYLQYLDWRQQVRSDSKYPSPDKQALADAKQEIANEHLDVVLGGGEVVVRGGGGGGAEQASSAKALSAGGALNGNAVAYIPLNDGSEFGVSKELAAELSTLYPAVDVPQTLNEIRGWNLAHPAKRKTSKGVVAHINTWMSKEQNRG